MAINVDDKEKQRGGNREDMIFAAIALGTIFVGIFLYWLIGGSQERRFRKIYRGQRALPYDLKTDYGAWVQNLSKPKQLMLGPRVR